MPEPMTTASYSKSVGALADPLCSCGSAGGAATVATAEVVMVFRPHLCVLTAWRFEHTLGSGTARHHLNTAVLQIMAWNARLQIANMPVCNSKFTFGIDGPWHRLEELAKL